MSNPTLNNENIVADWIKSRGTSMNGEAYDAAVDLVTYALNIRAALATSASALARDEASGLTDDVPRLIDRLRDGADSDEAAAQEIDPMSYTPDDPADIAAGLECQARERRECADVIERQAALIEEQGYTVARYLTEVEELRALLAASSAATVSDAVSVYKSVGNCFAMDGKTPTHAVHGLGVMVLASDFNVLWASCANHPVTTAEAQDGRAPYGNCRFQICDLPGQCIGEGKCHHPAVAAARAASSATAPLTSDSDALTADDADMVWPDDDGESMFHSIDDAVDYVVDLNWPDAEPLEITLQIAKRIPSATVRIFNITENGHEWEIVTNADRAQSTNGEQS